MSNTYSENSTDNSFTNVAVSMHSRSLRQSDVLHICSWVQDKKKLQLISSDAGSRLTPKILSSWEFLALESIVIADGNTDSPIGYCTLSCNEVSKAPHNFLELCHLIVDPKRNYFLTGSEICTAAKKAAASLKFDTLYGRVVPHNSYGLRLAKKQNFIEARSLHPFLSSEFRWFYYNLRGYSNI